MNLRNNFKIGMVPALMMMVLSQHSAQAQVCQPSSNGTKALLDLMKGSSDLKQVSLGAPIVPDEWTRKLILVNPKGTPFEALSSDGVMTRNPIQSSTNMSALSSGRVVVINKCFAVSVAHVVDGLAGGAPSSQRSPAMPGEKFYGHFSRSCNFDSDFTEKNIPLELVYSTSNDKDLDNFRANDPVNVLDFALLSLNPNETSGDSQSFFHSAKVAPLATVEEVRQIRDRNAPVLLSGVAASLVKLPYFDKFMNSLTLTETAPKAPSHDQKQYLPFIFYKYTAVYRNEDQAWGKSGNDEVKPVSAKGISGGGTYAMIKGNLKLIGLNKSESRSIIYQDLVKYFKQKLQDPSLDPKTRDQIKMFLNPPSECMMEMASSSKSQI